MTSQSTSITATDFSDCFHSDELTDIKNQAARDDVIDPLAELLSRKVQLILTASISITYH